MIRLKKLKIRDLLEYLIVIFTILDATTMWKYITNGLVQRWGVNVNITKYLIWLCILIYLYIGNRVIKLTRKKVYLIAAVIVFNGLYLLISRENMLQFVRGFLLVLFFWILFIWELDNQKRFSQFLSKASNVIYVLAVISLFFYLFGTLLHLIPAASVNITRNASDGIKSMNVPCYLHLMYNGQTQVFLGKTLYRNTGIFLEAPGWAFYLSVAIMLELFFRNTVNKTRVAVLTIAAFTTFATKAMMIIPILIFLKFIQEKPKKKLDYYKRLLVPFAAAAFLIYFFWLMEDKAANNSESYYARVEDISAAFQVWKNHLLFGVGYNVTSAFQPYLTFQKSSTITTGLLKMLAQCGIYISIEYLGGLAYLFISEKEKRYPVFAALALVIFFLLVTGTWQNMVLLYAVSSGLARLAYRKRKVRRRHERNRQ